MIFQKRDKKNKIRLLMTYIHKKRKSKFKNMLKIKEGNNWKEKERSNNKK